MTTPARTCAVVGCVRRPLARQLCATHYRRMRAGDTNMARPIGERGVRLDIAEVEHLAGWERDPQRLAARLGYRSWDSLERALYRAGRPDLVAAMKAGREVAWAVTA